MNTLYALSMAFKYLCKSEKIVLDAHASSRQYCAAHLSRSRVLPRPGHLPRRRGVPDGRPGVQDEGDRSRVVVRPAAAAVLEGTDAAAATFAQV